MQKNKMLFLVDMFRQESDEEHPITTNEIIEKLSAAGISCDRKTLSRDIAQINALGYKLNTVRKGHSNAYYMENKEFELAELKILIDAVHASSAIPEDITDNLIKKIANLGGSHYSELLQDNRICFNIRKQGNNDVLNTIRVIEESFRNQTQISFLYFKHDENGNRIYQHEGERYFVDPIALIYTDDNYYLRCYNSLRGNRNYRIDRIADVQLEEGIISDNALVSADELATYTSKTFKMYGGEENEITLEFDESLADVIFDQFGMNTKITRINETTLSTKVNVQISGTFWGWLFQFPEKMRITEPESVIEKCKEWTDKFINNYK